MKEEYKGGGTTHMWHILYMGWKIISRRDAEREENNAR